jgi:hypothetical protein
MNTAGCMDNVADLLGGGRTIAYKTDLAHATGSVTAGLLLSQFWYWSNSRDVADRDGWFWKTMPDITDETGLTRTEQENARKRLVQHGILREERRGTPAKLWFRLDKNALYELLAQYLANKNDGNTQSSLQVSRKLDSSKPASKSEGNQQSFNTENTTKNTTADIAAADLLDISEDSHKPADRELQRLLIENGVNKKDASRLASMFPEECTRQLVYMPFMTNFKSTKGAYLRTAIEQGFSAPKAYIEEEKNKIETLKQNELRLTKEAHDAQKEVKRQEIVSYLREQLLILQAQDPKAYTDFENEFERKKASQLKFVGNSALREKLEAHFVSDEKRVEVFIDYISGKQCPLPELTHWLSQNSVAEIKKLLSLQQ